MSRSRLVLTSLFGLALVVALPAAADAVGVPAQVATDVASLFAEDPLFTPAPKPMAPVCHTCSSTISTSPGGGNPSHTGYGATCEQAQNDVRAQLSAVADTYCYQIGDYGRCAFSVVFTCLCRPDGGQWASDAYATYRCWANYCLE
jgi:hypothetical protein